MNALAVVIAVLSYNVHGLSRWVVDDDPEARLPAISAKLDTYDVALIQEIWTNYELLAARAHHPVRERGNGPNPGVLFQTGLAAFARGELLAVSRGSLGACSGWLGGANDCLADKGYLQVRLRLANGVALDFWTLHLDAGEGDDDRAARAKQLDSLVERVQTISGDSALIVAGDFNCSADNPADAALLDRFKARLDLWDTGARSDPAGAFAAKHIDYIFMREGRSGRTAIRMQVLAVGEATAFVTAGNPLSDHPAVWARVQVTPVSGP